jgi:hypothetical protein
MSASMCSLLAVVMNCLLLASQMTFASIIVGGRQVAADCRAPVAS